VIRELSGVRNHNIYFQLSIKTGPKLNVRNAEHQQVVQTLKATHAVLGDVSNLKKNVINIKKKIENQSLPKVCV
jgi:hypothetical protein